jgi:hypothetical protein
MDEVESKNAIYALWFCFDASFPFRRSRDVFQLALSVRKVLGRTEQHSLSAGPKLSVSETSIPSGPGFSHFVQNG